MGMATAELPPPLISCGTGRDVNKKNVEACSARTLSQVNSSTLMFSQGFALQTPAGHDETTGYEMEETSSGNPPPLRRMAIDFHISHDHGLVNYGCRNGLRIMAQSRTRN